MTVDLTTLKPEDIEAFLRWVRDQKNYYSDLEKRVMSSLSLNGSPKKGENHLRSDDSDAEDVVYTILKKSGRWMGNAEIREEFERVSGQPIDRLTLRSVLKGGEGSRFKRQGQARLTEWKAFQ